MDNQIYLTCEDGKWGFEYVPAGNKQGDESNLKKEAQYADPQEALDVAGATEGVERPFTAMADFKTYREETGKGAAVVDTIQNPAGLPATGDSANSVVGNTASPDNTTPSAPAGGSGSATTSRPTAGK